jgi:hypothetical protein
LGFPFASFFVLKKAWRIIYKEFCSCLERCLSIYNNLIRSTIVNIHIHVNRIEDAESLGLIERRRTLLCHAVFYVYFIFILVKLAIKRFLLFVSSFLTIFNSHNCYETMLHRK